MERAGFTNIWVKSRNDWYRERARDELKLIEGPLYSKAAASLGRAFVDHNLEIWRNMAVVLNSGEHRPTHLRGA
jgi:hypothetical protein